MNKIFSIFFSEYLLHRTEIIKKTVNPEWKLIEISMRLLCSSNPDR